MRYRTSVMLLVVLVAVVCATGAAWANYSAARRLMLDALKSNAMGLAQAAAAAVDVEAHDRARAEGSQDGKAYKEVESALRRLRDAWRESGIDVRFVYTLGPDPKAPLGFSYVVDAEEAGSRDKSKVGEWLEFGATDTAPPDPSRLQAVTSTDSYGSHLTGLAPVRGGDGRIAAVAGVDLALSTVTALERRLAWTGAMTTGAVLSISLVIAAAVARRIVSPLERLRQVADSIAHGRLTESPTEAGAREVAALAGSLASMCNSLRDIIARVKDSSRGVDQACRQLLQDAVRERDRARGAATDAIDSAAKAGEIASTARGLAEAAAELRNVSSEVVAAGGAGIDNLRGISQRVDQLRATGAGLASQIESVRERARAVDGFLEAMVAVADQSNLLSLNAEIEASKAGDAGRGFMVVAGEIRRLAEQAAASSLQIEANVRAMHEALEGGVNATQRLADDLRDGAELARQGTGLLEASVQGIESLAPRIAQVADGSERQREGAAAISTTLGRIAEAATTALGFLESVGTLVGDLQHRASELEKDVQRFVT